MKLTKKSMMEKTYLDKNVYEMAKERIKFVFNEFENVVISISGGKDSTVLMELAVDVAEKMGRLPIDVVFLDQEVEFMHTIEYIRKLKKRSDINLHWFQIPFDFTVSNSLFERNFRAWDETKEELWMREKEKDSIKDVGRNDLVHFTDTIEYVKAWLFGFRRFAGLIGMRAEESFCRHVGMVDYPAYKYVTWANVSDVVKDAYNFYPLYDWSYRDVWKAIHDNGWEYNRIYDYMFANGVPIRHMRVSSLIHEKSVHTIKFLHDVEFETYDRLLRRVGGVHTISQLGDDAFCVDELPYMFSSWIEYRDYLLEHLITDEKRKAKFRRFFDKLDQFIEVYGEEYICKKEIEAILKNDDDVTLLHFWNVLLSTDKEVVKGERRNKRRGKKKVGNV